MTNYIILKSDGSVLGTVVAGTVNSALTSLTLVGKGAVAYGDEINTNFVHLTENFANNVAPANPLSGQLWFDTSANTLSVYYNSTWNEIEISTGFGAPPVGSVSAGGTTITVITTPSGPSYAAFSPISVNYPVIAGGNLSAFTDGLGAGLTFSNLTDLGIYGTSALAFGIGTTKGAEFKIGDFRLISNSAQQVFRLISNTAPSALALFRNTAGDFSIEKSNPGGNANISLNPLAESGTENTFVRLFRDTNTTGQRALVFYRGNGSTEINARIGVDNQNSYVQLGGGNFGVATSAPTEKFEVLGTAKAVQIIVSGQGQSYKLPTSAGTSGQVLATRGNGLETYWVDRGPRIRWEVIDVTSLTVGSNSYTTPDTSNYPEIRVVFNGVAVNNTNTAFRMRIVTDGVPNTNTYANVLVITSGTGNVSAISESNSFIAISRRGDMNNGIAASLFGTADITNGALINAGNRGGVVSQVRYAGSSGQRMVVLTNSTFPTSAIAENLIFFTAGGGGGTFLGGRIVVEALVSS